MSRYTSPDEARSDLFLAGATYLLGRTVLGLLFTATRLDRLPGVSPTLRVLVPILTTVVVPVLLMRYRKESLRDLGLGRSDASIAPGLLAGLPLIAASVAAALLASQPITTGLPVLNVGASTDVFSLLVALLEWAGLLFLAFYCTVKARDAFRGEPQDLEDAVVRVGRFVGIAGGVALVLLILAFFSSLRGLDVLGLVAYPVGVAAAVFVALRAASGARTTTLPTVLTPVVLLALGPFALQFNATAFVAGVYAAALYGGLGLVVAVLVERTRQGAGVLALALVLGLATQFSGLGGGL